MYITCLVFFFSCGIHPWSNSAFLNQCDVKIFQVCRKILKYTVSTYKQHYFCPFKYSGMPLNSFYKISVPRAKKRLRNTDLMPSFYRGIYLNKLFLSWRHDWRNLYWWLFKLSPLSLFRIRVLIHWIVTKKLFDMFIMLVIVLRSQYYKNILFKIVIAKSETSHSIQGLLEIKFRLFIHNSS